MTRTFHAHAFRTQLRVSDAAIRKGIRLGIFCDESCGGTCKRCRDAAAFRKKHHWNQKGHHAMHTHARGQDGDRRQLIADLISRDESPFTPDDQMALAAMSDTALRRVAARYLRGNSAQEETARRRNNSHVQTLLVRHRDGYYVEVPSQQQATLSSAPVRANEAEAEDDEAVAAMTFGHRLADELRANATRARDLRRAKSKKAGHDARAWTRDSPYTPDDEAAAARGGEDGEEVEDHQAAIAAQARAAMQARNRRSGAGRR